MIYIVGTQSSVLINEVSLFQRCPLRGVPLYNITAKQRYKNAEWCKRTPYQAGKLVQLTDSVLWYLCDPKAMTCFDPTINYKGLYWHWG